MQTIINYFKSHRIEIEMLAENGDKTCKNILNLYYIYYRCPGDMECVGLLIAAINNYKRRIENV